MSKGSAKLAMAVCASCTVPPAKASSTQNGDHSSGDPAVLENGQMHTSEPGMKRVEFFVTWHVPRVYFRSAIVAYKR